MTQPLRREGAKPLTAMANEQLLKSLETFVRAQDKTATFTCGGSVPLRALKEQSITVRWDPAEVDKATDTNTVAATGPCKLVITENVKDQDVLAASLDRLIRDGQPATFGHAGGDVFDENYRKATKLDTSQFCSSFNPYEVGIIDVIAQMLLPTVVGDSSKRGVRAELYKLNVYSGPSGLFKKHVDTPRGGDQFGSLVVCLPYTHTGGELVVRHKGKEVVFDWGRGSINDTGLQWAAFYSDCEHEVKEVALGHRLTLTYNLFVTRGAGALAGHSSAMDPQYLPLYEKMRAALEQPAFMTKGGTLGIKASHLYAHTRSKKIHHLPSSLKGVDMATYSVFRALGLKTKLRPWMKQRSYEDEEEEDDFNDYLEGKDIVRKKLGKEEFDSLLREWQIARQKIAVGKNIHMFEHTDQIVEYGEYDTILGEWPHRLESITWLNEDHEVDGEPALDYMTYGNEYDHEMAYSSIAIFVTVPPFKNRDLDFEPLDSDRSSSGSFGGAHASMSDSQTAADNDAGHGEIDCGMLDSSFLPAPNDETT